MYLCGVCLFVPPSLSLSVSVSVCPSVGLSISLCISLKVIHQTLRYVGGLVGRVRILAQVDRTPVGTANCRRQCRLLRTICWLAGLLLLS